MYHFVCMFLFCTLHMHAGGREQKNHVFFAVFNWQNLSFFNFCWKFLTLKNPPFWPQFSLETKFFVNLLSFWIFWGQKIAYLHFYVKWKNYWQVNDMFLFSPVKVNIPGELRKDLTCNLCFFVFFLHFFSVLLRRIIRGFMLPPVQSSSWNPDKNGMKPQITVAIPPAKLQEDCGGSVQAGKGICQFRFHENCKVQTFQQRIWNDLKSSVEGKRKRN